MANPYQGVGQIASGARFVERQELTKEILEAWNGQRPGNLSLRGNFRMGKSSLIRDAATKFHAANPDRIAVVIGAGRIKDGVSLFRGIARRAYASLSEIGAARHLLPGAQRRLSAALESDMWSDVSEAVADFLCYLGDSDIGAMIAIDEFDRLSDWCGTPEFQFLRDLASEPEYRVGLTTVSRKSVYEIEVAGSHGSHLGGVLGHSLSVGLMSEEEATALVLRAGDSGVDISPWYGDILGSSQSRV